MIKLMREEFAETIKEQVSIKMGGTYNVDLHHVLKNNGKELNCIIIKGMNQDVSPIIYLDCYYNAYLNGKTVDTIVNDVIHIYLNSQNNVSFDEKQFMQFSMIRDKIVMKLINYSKNQKLLKDVPHKRILDLAIIPYIVVDVKLDSHASIKILNKHLKMWEVTAEEIFRYAEINSKHLLPSVIMRMEDIVNGLTKNNDEFQEDLISDLNMYVLSNRNNINGASCMIYDGVLKKFAAKHKSDIVILPSSVHETILLPINDKFNAKDLRNMVCDVNSNEMLDEEVLSNNVYRYEYKTDTLKIME